MALVHCVTTYTVGDVLIFVKARDYYSYTDAADLNWLSV